MKQARFTREARAELLAQTAYYETIRKGLGARFRAEVEQAALLATTFPQHGKAGPAETRRRLIANFPFKLYYTEAPYGILVHAVAGDRQMPEHWLRRLAKREG